MSHRSRLGLTTAISLCLHLAAVFVCSRDAPVAEAVEPSPAQKHEEKPAQAMELIEVQVQQPAQTPAPLPPTQVLRMDPGSKSKTPELTAAVGAPGRSGNESRRRLPPEVPHVPPADGTPLGAQADGSGEERGPTGETMVGRGGAEESSSVEGMQEPSVEAGVTKGTLNSGADGNDESSLVSGSGPGSSQGEPTASEVEASPGSGIPEVGVMVTAVSEGGEEGQGEVGDDGSAPEAAASGVDGLAQEPQGASPEDRDGIRWKAGIQIHSADDSCLDDLPPFSDSPEAGAAGPLSPPEPGVRGTAPPSPVPSEAPTPSESQAPLASVAAELRPGTGIPIFEPTRAVDISPSPGGGNLAVVPPSDARRPALALEQDKHAGVPDDGTEVARLRQALTATTHVARAGLALATPAEVARLRLALMRAEAALQIAEELKDPQLAGEAASYLAEAERVAAAVHSAQKSDEADQQAVERRVRHIATLVAPQVARRQGRHGLVVIRMKLDGAGYVASSRIVRSSRVPSFDLEAPAILMLGAPYPARHRTFEVSVPFQP